MNNVSFTGVTHFIGPFSTFVEERDKGNIPGYDGETISRLNGKTIEKTTIKAASGPNGMVRNVKDVFEAIKTTPLRFIRKARLEEELEEAVTALLNRYHSLKNYYDPCAS